MLRAILTSIVFLVTFSVPAQTLNGVVIDGETKNPLSPVIIVNAVTQQSTTTDAEGNYSISAKPGETISYSFTGFHTIERLATSGTPLNVEMFLLTVKLPEYVLHPEYTPFQKDSAQMATLYGKELNVKPIKVGYSSANGGGFTGLIGAPVQKISRSYRKNKKFKAAFKKDMEQKYIDTRYTLDLVNTLTGYTGDTLAIFMNTYPMEYSFARTASDLEIKMWVRDNYKDYLHKKEAQH